ncbi:hypothetical protein DFS33DRAFT_90995 [Desarmillaria ectypa]|nr:hypothetical protein DFS33DRAFT_90995 [Desarmillaria ectypa]
MWAVHTLAAIFNGSRLHCTFTSMSRKCYLFTPSPQELASKTLASKPLSRRTTFISILPGHIRVQFYTHARYAIVNRPPCIQADIRLSDSGDLEVQTFKDVFGLHSCAIVDEHGGLCTRTESIISFRDILEFSDSRACIKVTEPYISDSVRMQREIRCAMLLFLRSLEMLITTTCAIWLYL